MMQWKGLLAVLTFELRRTLTVPRILIWLVFFVIIPPLLVTAAAFGAVRAQNRILPEVIAFIIYILIPEMSCIGGLLLWMAPAIQGELESKTWTYLAVRPYGRRVVLIGKYITAILWSMSAVVIALSVSVLIAQFFQPEVDMVRTFSTMFALSLISCLGRGAAYAVFAVALPQRAMVFAFVYTIIFEYFVGLIPAMINQLTVQFHLRCLLVNWMGWSNRQLPRMIFDDAPSWQHLLALAAYVAIVLPTAILILERRQFPSSEEG